MQYATCYRIAYIINKKERLNYMKNVLKIFIVLLLMFNFMVVPARAFTPEAEDIYYYLGYNVDSGLSVITPVSNGIKLDYKYDKNNMWANRVAMGYPYKLDSTEGLYVKLSDIKWDDKGSVMITVSSASGGWSDIRSMMFWIIKGDVEEKKGWKYHIAGIRGADGNETNIETFFMPYQEITSNISSSIIFAFRKTSATEWTLNINEQQFKISDSIVQNRFLSMNPLYLSLGTWNSACAISYVVSDLYYKGAFGSPPPALPIASTPTSGALPTATVTNSVTSGVQSSSILISSNQINSENTSNSMSQISESETTSSGSSSQNISNTLTESSINNSLDNTDKNNSNLIIIIALVIAAVLVAGGLVYYFIFVKGKRISK